jgi:hypothetical protein
LQFNLLESEKSLKTTLTKNIPNYAPHHYAQLLEQGYDAVNSRGYHRADLYCRSIGDILWRSISIRLFKHYPISKCDQRKINKWLYTEEDRQENVYPTLMPNWDRTPRSGRKARIYTNSTPEVFGEQIDKVLDLIKDKEPEHKIVFLMSWNEWAEGNYIEPDMRYGHRYLNILKEKLFKEQL